MTKKRYVPTKKLGSKRIDLPLSKKKECMRRIVTLKQAYKVVRKINLEEFKKDLSYSTFRKWRDTGATVLDPEFEGVNCRASFKKSDVIDKFERRVIEIIENSNHDIDGVLGLILECQKLQSSDEFKDEEEVKKMQFSISTFFVSKIGNFL